MRFYPLRAPRRMSPPLPLFLIALLTSLSPPRVRPLAAQEADPRIARVENGISGAIQVRGREAERFSIQERMAFYNVPGASVAVLDGGRIAWAKGYGVKDAVTGEPVTPETLFQAASISKPVAATAALRLVDEGLLELDTPVNNYLRGWKIPENNFTRENPVTMKHLLSHTGGLTVHGFPGYAIGADVPSTVEVLDGSGPSNTDSIRVDTVPGSLWRYSGGGYTILQKLLEDVTGEAFPRVLREKVLDPVGMSLSGYEQPIPPEKATYAASSHLSDGTGGDGKWHIYPEMAAAGLWTNPTELAMLAMELQASYHGEEGRVLSPEMTRAMFTPVLGGYGLGFGLQGEGEEARFSHGGSNYGFRAQFLAFMEGGRGVFVMTNGDRGSALAQEITLAVAREYGWPVPGYREVILADVAPETLEEIAGTYRIEDQEMELRVQVVGDHLRVEIPDVQVFELHPTGPDFFIDLADGGRVRVDRDQDGRVSALQLLGGPRAVRVEGDRRH
ncbi:MAG: serine hydrolase domain-containing protein [Longimicrobiales bacterium]